MSDSLRWTSATATQALIVSGQLSAVAVIEACLKRIDQLNPALNAFCHVDHSGALAAAQQADAALADGLQPGVLHGVPVAIKDDLWVKGMPATCGSLLFANFHPTCDGTVAERLRAAGAIIVGKTTMPEFAAWPRSKSYLAGEAVNPWDRRRIAGASSGGSAAAVAAGMVPVAIGTDGGGSTRIPAALTGLVGLFPTLGQVPAAGSFCCSPSQSAGPLTRSVVDAARVQTVIAGPEPGQKTRFNLSLADTGSHLDDGVEQLSLGWSADFGWIPVNPAVATTVRSSLDLLVQQGASVHQLTERIDHPWGDGSLMGALHLAVAAVGDPSRPLGDSPDMAGVEAWLAESASQGELCFTRPEFIALVKNHHLLLTPPQQCLATVPLVGVAIPSPAALNKLMDTLFAHYDVICSPTMATVAPLVPSGWASAYDDSYMGTHFTFIANATGCPAVSVPCGMVDNLPVGLQIIGRRGDEATVLRVARAVEKIRPPLPTPA